MDAFRADAVASTKTVGLLAEENVYFEDAITPATWSLPAHASLLTGQYPHDHGVTRSGDKPSRLPLVETLKDRGYTTYGVSGNPFFSQNQGFASPFDRFWYTTLMRFPDGIDVSNYPELSSKLSDIVSGDRAAMGYVWDFITNMLSHDHRLKSLGNLLYALGIQLELEDRGLRNIAHPFVDNSLAYRPEINTSIIQRIFEREADSDTPFFVFTNYMDTHDPYNPPREFRSERTADLDWSEIKRINEELNSWQFLSDNVDEDRLQLLRELYDGEVRSVDSHVTTLLRALEEYGLREDTIVVITADHGENLGEVDRRGRRRMGHISSLSDSLVKVPLVVAHPSTESVTVSEPVSTKDVASAVIDDTLFTDGTIDPSALCPEDGVVLCEAPARGGKDALMENHPEIPTEMVEQETTQSNILGRLRGWRIIRSSTGETWAWDGDTPTTYASSPETLRHAVERAHELLIEHATDEELSDSAITRLEDLGYV